MSAVTPAAIRLYQRWPEEIPDGFLCVHAAAALREVQAETGLTSPPAGGEEDWAEAVTVAAAASALPKVHTIAQPGAAMSIRSLQGDNKLKFLEPREVEAQLQQLQRIFDKLCRRLRAMAAKENQDQGLCEADGQLWSAI